MTRKLALSILGVVTALVFTALPSWSAGNQYGKRDFGTYEWSEINPDSPWTPRAGLQVLNHHGTLFLMGGRTPKPPTFPPIIGDSTIWADVWRSEDSGASWELILETDTPGQWPGRAYFQAVSLGPYMYVLGGQNFKAGPDVCPPEVSNCSDFFNDVWRSRDGMDWTQMTPAADWEGRAGLSAVAYRGHIYVMGGSLNDDASIGGPGGPERFYFNDVWRSKDGQAWELVTEEADWSPRAGAVALVHQGYLYLLGGEVGFLCEPFPFCDPPYFNDVWRSKDGATWEQVTDFAGWSPRPGHQCVSLLNRIVCLGGFGLSQDPANPFAAGNPMDVWVSRAGENWTQISDSPWNSMDPADGRYDFDILAGWFPGFDGYEPTILTFGGDQETFDFADPFNYMKVKNDVWRFSPPAQDW